jgi:hypothetical protein
VFSWFGNLAPEKPGQGRSASVLVYRECILTDRFAHTGQTATRDEVLAARVMEFSVARTPIRFSSLGVGRIVRESDMGNLDDLLDLVGCQLAAPPHRKLGRTTKQGQVQGISCSLSLSVRSQRF